MVIKNNLHWAKSLSGILSSKNKMFFRQDERFIK